MDNNKVIDTCRLLGNYNGENIYLYSSAKYDRPRLFYTPNYFYLPKWADAEKLTLLQAVKIINYRMKNNDSDNLKPEDLKIMTIIIILFLLGMLIWTKIKNVVIKSIY